MKRKKSTIKKVLATDGFLIQPIVGKSMMPMLNEHKDTVKLVPVTRELHAGDIPLYRRPSGQYVLHRIVTVEKSHYVIRGDNCVNTEIVPKRWVLAVTDGYYKNGTYIPVTDSGYLSYVKKVLEEGKPFVLDEWRYLSGLLVASITGGDVPPVPDNISWNEIICVCRRQKVAAAIATVISKCKPQPPEEIRKSFEEAAGLALKREILFAAERKKILDAFEEQHIRYIPMKVLVLGRLYPRQGVREFVDNDILYDVSRQKDVVKIMVSLGYHVISLQTVHDVFQKEPIFNFELHKALFDEASPYASAFTNIFDRVIQDAPGSSGFHMTDEDFYLHFIAHLAKHSLDAGSGLRPLTDLYLLNKYHEGLPNYNRDYVKTTLTKLGLSEFESEMSTMAKNLFEHGMISDDNLREILAGGVYGNTIKALVAEVRREGKLHYLIKRLFLPYYDMKKIFPILRPLPFLLPIFWLVRLFRAVILKEKRSRSVAQAKIALKTNTKKTEGS